MKGYDKEVFEKLILLIRNKDKEAEQWLIDEGYQELREFWDACEGMEKSFRWLLDNNYQQLAATVDALNGNDPAKAYLLKSGNRELAAFVEATTGSQKAISWLLQFKHHGWVMVAKEFFDIEKKNEKSFIWNFLNFGNPFR
jgi:hypothetical protein